ncbi:reverse transcriptase [compost metagenome]
MEDRRRLAATKGAPQAAVISPLLANIYLPYVLDLWARQWRQRHARGEVIVVRYADDRVVGFRTQWQAQCSLVQLQERMARFGLSLNASKTRLIEFGRFRYFVQNSSMDLSLQDGSSWNSTVHLPSSNTSW